MNARRRFRIKLFLLGLSFFLALPASYCHFGLLPGKLKAYAIHTIEETTHKKVHFDKILFLPFQGLLFKNLAVRNEDGSPLFSSKTLALNVRLIPFLQEKKIVVSRLRLENPVYEFFLKPEGASPALPPPMTQISGQIPIPSVDHPSAGGAPAMLEEGLGALLPENVYLEQIEISGGQVTVRENAASPVIETIQISSLRLVFQKPPLLAIEGSMTLGEKPYAGVEWKGAWNLDDGHYEFLIDGRLQSIPGWLLECQKNYPLILKKGAVTANTRLKNDGSPQIQWTSFLQLNPAEIQIDTKEFLGNALVQASGLWDIREKSLKNVNGRVELSQARLTGLSPEIPSLHDMEGELSFTPDTITLHSLRGRLENIPLEAEGVIESFAQPAFRLNVHIRSSLSELLKLLPPGQQKHLEGFDVQGSCRVDTKVTGAWNDPSPRMEHRLQIENASIKNNARKIEINLLSSEIEINDAFFNITRAEFEFAKKQYELRAAIPRGAAEGTLTLRSKELHLTADYFVQNNALLVQKASLEWNGISAASQGEILNLREPVLDLSGQARIDLESFSAWAAPFAPQLKNSGLRGRLEGAFVLKGPWNKPLEWEGKWDAGGDPVFIQKTLALRQFHIQCYLRNRKLSVPFLRAAPYGGTLLAKAFFDLSEKGTYFESALNLTNLNLRALVEDLPVKQKDFAGILTCQTTLNGLLSYPETYQGQGTVDVRNGKLWQTSLFKPMGHLPFLKVGGLDEVVLHDLDAAFTVHDKKAWTENLHVFGSAVDLSLRGAVGFDQNLDLLMTIRYSKGTLQSAQEAGGLIPFFVQEAEDFISDYKISGTLKEPKYEKRALPVGRVIGKKISSLLQKLVPQ